MQQRKYYLPLLIIALALVARWIPGPRTIDDSYITFRYARNILAGEGFVFNPGEPVLGTTTPALYSFDGITGCCQRRNGCQLPDPGFDRQQPGRCSHRNFTLANRQASEATPGRFGYRTWSGAYCLTV